MGLMMPESEDGKQSSRKKCAQLSTLVDMMGILWRAQQGADVIQLGDIFKMVLGRRQNNVCLGQCVPEKA